MGLGNAAGGRAASAGLWVALVAALLPGALHAQESALMEDEPERRPALELSGSIGLFTPLSSLASTDVQAVDTAVVVRTDLSTTVAFAVELDYFMPSGLGFGAQAVYSSPDVTAQQVDTTAVPPAFLSLGTADYWALSGSVMYRPHLVGAAAQVVPFAAIGAGVRSLSFSQDGVLALSNSTDFMGTAALGAVARLADWIGLRGELRYNLTSYKSALTGDSKLQNDVFVLVGATARLAR